MKSRRTSGKGFGRHKKADPKPTIKKTKEAFFLLENLQTAQELVAPNTLGSEWGTATIRLFKKQYNH